MVLDCPVPIVVTAISRKVRGLLKALLKYDCKTVALAVVSDAIKDPGIGFYIKSLSTAYATL